MSVGDWAQVASAAGAMLAAIFAARAVALSTRQQRQAEEPDLLFDLISVAGRPSVMSVENIGGGVARKASFRLVASTDRMAAGFITPDGRLRPGETYDVILDATPEEFAAAQAMTLCLDRRHRVHAWSREGDHRSWSQTRWVRAGRGDMWAFRRFYPKANIERYPDMTHKVVSRRVS